MAFSLWIMMQSCRAAGSHGMPDLGLRCDGWQLKLELALKARLKV